MLRLILALFVVIAAYGQCPIEITKVNPNETESWSRVGRSAIASNKGKSGKLPPDFTVKLKNTNGKAIRGMKLLAGYYDSVEDVHVIPTAWDANTIVKAGEEKAIHWDNFEYSDKAYIGWVVVPTKILFEDGTKWKYTDETKGCFGEFWRDKKHPRLTGLPDELLKKALKGEEN